MKNIQASVSANARPRNSRSVAIPCGFQVLCEFFFGDIGFLFFSFRPSTNSQTPLRDDDRSQAPSHLGNALNSGRNFDEMPQVRLLGSHGFLKSFWESFVRAKEAEGARTRKNKFNALLFLFPLSSLPPQHYHRDASSPTTSPSTTPAW